MTREKITGCLRTETGEEYHARHKRQEIREGIALTYLQWKMNDTTLQLKDIVAFLRSECFDFTDEVMKQEAAQGVVIKVERELPLLSFENSVTGVAMFERELGIQRDMLKAGYVVVEPLIEVCDHKWIELRNEVITSGEICTKCKAIRPETVEPLIEEG